MKVVLPEKKVFNKKQIIFYVTILMICAISLIIAFYVQFYARIDIASLIFGIEKETEFGTKSEESIARLESEFDTIFTNSIENQEDHDSKKIEKDKPLVYTQVEKKESKLNSYDIEVHIPYINIDNQITKKYNEEIDQFIEKTDSIVKKASSTNTIYTVEYVANVYNGILSLMISSNLKEGANAQRVIIKTINYELRNNKEISLEEVLKIEHINMPQLQSKINTKIEAEQKKVQDLKDLGYNVFGRDAKDSRYKIENSDEFYLTNNTLYIIYAYGNSAYTSERDLVII